MGLLPISRSFFRQRFIAIGKMNIEMISFETMPVKAGVDSMGKTGKEAQCNENLCCQGGAHKAPSEC